MRLSIVVLFGLVCGRIFAQSPTLIPLGARAFGMAGATVTVSDNWAALSNPAGLGGIDKTLFSAGYFNRYHIGLRDFGTAYATLSGKMGKSGGWGLVAVRFGADLYSQQRLGLSYGLRYEGIALGISASYLQIAQKDLPSIGAAVMDFGSIVRLTQTVYMGAFVSNFTQAKLAPFEDERLPTLIRMGVSYRPNDKLMLNLDTEKDIEKQAFVRAGLEYRLSKHLFARTGVINLPSSGYFGVGFESKRFVFGYAFGTHPQLGMSHQFSASFVLARKDAQKKE